MDDDFFTDATASRSSIILHEGYLIGKWCFSEQYFAIFWESVGEDCQGLGHIVYESTNSKVITDYQEEIARLE